VAGEALEGRLRPLGTFIEDITTGKSQQSCQELKSDLAAVVESFVTALTGARINPLPAAGQYRGTIRHLDCHINEALRLYRASTRGWHAVCRECDPYDRMQRDLFRAGCPWYHSGRDRLIRIDDSIKAHFRRKEEMLEEQRRIEKQCESERRT